MEDNTTDQRNKASDWLGEKKGEIKTHYIEERRLMEVDGNQLLNYTLH